MELYFLSVSKAYFNQIIDSIAKAGGIPGIKITDTEENDPKSK